MKEKEKREFNGIIMPVLKNEEFQKRKKYCHHDDSVFEHSLKVAQLAYKISKKLKLDYRSATIGAILHDFYYHDWQQNKKKKSFFKLHGFAHAAEAKENAKTHFPHMMNKKIENIIERHMFPLTIRPPFYLESWLVCLIDKGVSLTILKNPRKLPRYIGLKEVKNDRKNDCRNCNHHRNRRD